MAEPSLGQMIELALMPIAFGFLLAEVLVLGAAALCALASRHGLISEWWADVLFSATILFGILASVAAIIAFAGMALGQ